MAMSNITTVTASELMKNNYGITLYFVRYLTLMLLSCYSISCEVFIRFLYFHKFGECEPFFETGGMVNILISLSLFHILNQ